MRRSLAASYKEVEYDSSLGPGFTRRSPGSRAHVVGERSGTQGLIGTWKLNVAKSKFSPGPAQKHDPHYTLRPAKA